MGDNKVKKFRLAVKKKDFGSADRLLSSINTNDRRRLLFRAAEECDFELVKVLTAMGVMFCNSLGGEECILKLIKHNQFELAIYILEEGLEQPDDYTLLHSVAGKGLEQATKLLIKRGVNVNAMIEEQVTPLLLAVSNDHLGTAKLLLASGGDVNAKCTFGKSILNHAIEMQNSEMLREILKNKPHILKEDLTLALSEQCGNVIDCFPVDPSKRNKLSADDVLLHSTILNWQCHIVSHLLQNDSNSYYQSFEYGFNKPGIRLMKCSVFDTNTIKKTDCLIRHDVDINKQDVHLRSGLFYAVYLQKSRFIGLFLQHGANVNLQDKNGLSPLLVCAEKFGFVEIFHRFMAHGGDIDSHDKKGKTILHIATETFNVDDVEAVLKYKPNINLKQYKNILIHFVINRKFGLDEERLTASRRIIDRLLAYGVPVNTDDTSHAKLLLFGAIITNHVCFLKKLLSLGADPSSHHNGMPLLNSACFYRNPKIVSILVEHGANVNAEDIFGRTAIMEAIRSCDLESTRLLYETGVNMDIKDIIYHSLFEGGGNEILEFLLRSAPDFSVNSVDIWKRTLIHYAISQNRPTCTIDLLVKFGADVNAKDVAGNTPLHLACMTNLLWSLTHPPRDKTMTCLLNYGADVNIANRDGKTPFQILMGSVESGNNTESLPLTEHILMRKAADLYVSAANLHLIVNNEEVAQFTELCHEEVRSLKDYTFENTTITFYNILAKDIHEIAKYAKNKEIFKHLTTINCKAIFPIYSSILHFKIQKGLKRRVLLKRGTKNFKSVFKSLPRLPHLCIDKILSYLSNDDLEILAEKYKRSKAFTEVMYSHHKEDSNIYLFRILYKK